MKTQLNHAWSKGDSEIKLFRKMSEILSTNYNVAFIEETHLHTISYHSATINQTAARELSDLWIITFSPSKKRIRTTFLQAKYHRQNILPSGTFKGDYFQFELLSTRPPLLTGSSFNFPADILSFSCCDSVGTYGVFYIDDTASIDMAYCCASKLTPAAVPTTYGQFSVPLIFPTDPISINSCNCNTCGELNYTYDIDFFTNNLLQLKIGAEIQFYPEIVSFVRTALSTSTVNNTATSELISLIDNGFRGPTDTSETVNRSSEGNPHILIINVDEKESTKNI